MPPRPPIPAEVSAQVSMAAGIAPRRSCSRYVRQRGWCQRRGICQTARWRAGQWPRRTLPIPALDVLATKDPDVALRPTARPLTAGDFTVALGQEGVERIGNRATSASEFTKMAGSAVGLKRLDLTDAVGKPAITHIFTGGVLSKAAQRHCRRRAGRLTCSSRRQRGIMARASSLSCLLWRVGRP